VVEAVKARRLSPGDHVGIISPSWGGAALFPHRVELGVRALERLGLRVKLGRHALNSRGFVSDSPANRAADVHDMFRDPEVRLIVAAIGGAHSCHLLPYLDFDLIREHPTLFMGYSDITVLNVAIWAATGLVTFNGPALLTDFAEYPEMFEYTRSWFWRTVTRPDPVGAIAPSADWTEEFLDWAKQEDLTRPRAMQRSGGWTWLKRGTAEGVLVGGCIESLQHLRGTRFWPSWERCILFVETSEMAPPPSVVDGMLMDYQNMGVFNRIRALLVGRPMRYTDDQRQQLRDVVLEHTKKFEFPVVTDMDFGHTAPQFTLPIGCRARVDVTAQRFEILESAVE
jgi:muramoyltetrapeptide carboxypeptidase LdcA involved in peptidoglycan recycling